MPWAFSSPSSLSWSIVDCPPAAGAAGGAGPGAGACCCSSCGAQRFPWRRDTRLLTLVAVPAMTAVRATPRNSPGMVMAPRVSGGGVGVGRVEGGDDPLHGDPAARDELGAGLAQRDGDRSGPAVLPDQDGSRGSGLERVSGVLEVVVADDPRRRALERGERAVAVEVGQVQRIHGAARVLADERDVDD